MYPKPNDWVKSAWIRRPKEMRDLLPPFVGPDLLSLDGSGEHGPGPERWPKMALLPGLVTHLGLVGVVPVARGWRWGSGEDGSMREIWGSMGEGLLLDGKENGGAWF
ncbi:hypothetical protein V6N12_013569 [Hibiscus sabdariffa]|uniref:Uncharacterized protein n=1 Tax=Hibiscus sabdariffa TaxID=183260 RepID=A0ABR2CA30_9ROSI